MCLAFLHLLQKVRPSKRLDLNIVETSWPNLIELYTARPYVGRVRQSTRLNLNICETPLPILIILCIDGPHPYVGRFVRVHIDFII